MAHNILALIRMAIIDAMIECRMGRLPVCLLTETCERAGIQPFVYGE